MLGGVSSDSPYRRPGPTPRAPARKRAVATSPETPEERDTREALELAGRRRRAFSTESAIAREELHRARRAIAIGMRLTGAALLGLAFFTIGLHAHSIADGATSLRVSRLGPFGLVLGPFLMIAGGGGAASKDSLPMWWRVGVFVAFGVGAVLGTELEIDMAIWIADLFF